MIKRTLVLALAVVAGCFQTPTERVRDTDSSPSTADGGPSDGGSRRDGGPRYGEAGADGGPVIVVPCTQDNDCKSAQLSRCDLTSNTCKPCTVNSQCSGRFDERVACVVGKGCFECATDNGCEGDDVCDPTQHKCGECSVATPNECASKARQDRVRVRVAEVRRVRRQRAVQEGQRERVQSRLRVRRVRGPGGLHAYRRRAAVLGRARVRGVPHEQRLQDSEQSVLRRRSVPPVHEGQRVQWRSHLR